MPDSRTVMGMGEKSGAGLPYFGSREVSSITPRTKAEALINTFVPTAELSPLMELGEGVREAKIICGWHGFLLTGRTNWE